jgi:hypothetical protein
MANGVAGHAIKEHPRGGGVEECGNPIPETYREAHFVKKVKKISPTDRIEGLPDVKLENEGRGFIFVEFCGKVFNIEKVIVYASSLD